MSTRIRIRAPKPVRRSHAERTADTRRRVLDAVVQCLAELGYRRTSGAEIAQRAGLTWGAIQHQFGDKNGVLAAALEESFERFALLVGEPDPKRESLEERVADFVDRAWLHFASDHYRTTFEILGNAPEMLGTTGPEQMLGAWAEVWARYFSDVRMPKRRAAELMMYTISVLTGMATTMRARRIRPVVGPSLELLKATLLRELGERR